MVTEHQVEAVRKWLRGKKVKAEWVKVIAQKPVLRAIRERGPHEDLIAELFRESDEIKAWVVQEENLRALTHILN